MPDGQQAAPRDTLDGVGRVALQALSRLAPGPADQRPPLESFLSDMFAAVLGTDPRGVDGVVQSMRKARVTTQRIAEVYVPIVAQRLGEAWVADTLPFGAVTVGSSRLQALLRQLGEEWDVPAGAMTDDRPCFLVGVPRGVQHTLGAAVLAGYLRHRGMSVHLDFDLTVRSVGEQIRTSGFRGVFLSASGVDHLESLRFLVQQVRRAAPGVPIFIGGQIEKQTKDLKDLTQADLITSDPSKALGYCEAVHRTGRDGLCPGGLR